MNIVTFEDAQLYFDDFLIGTLTDELELKGNINQAHVENLPDSKCGILHAPDLHLRFFLKEKSSGFAELLNSDSAQPSIAGLLSNFGTLKIVSTSNKTLCISDAFWAHYPFPEFQIKRNSSAMMHSVYFMWQD